MRGPAARCVCVPLGAEEARSRAGDFWIMRVSVPPLGRLLKPDCPTGRRVSVPKRLASKRPHPYVAVRKRVVGCWHPLRYGLVGLSKSVKGVSRRLASSRYTAGYLSGLHTLIMPVAARCKPHYAWWRLRSQRAERSGKTCAPSEFVGIPDRNPIYKMPSHTFS